MTGVQTCALPIFNTGDVATGVRLAIVISSIAISQQFVPIVPGYVTTLLVWLACVSPTLSLLHGSQAGQQAPLHDPVIVTMLQDVVVAALAGCLLFNESLWWRLTGRVRYLNTNQLIPDRRRCLYKSGARIFCLLPAAYLQSVAIGILTCRKLPTNSALARAPYIGLLPPRKIYF